MTGLFGQLLEAAQALLEGMFDFIGVFGREGRGRLISALLLGIVALLIFRFTSGPLARVIGAFFGGGSLYALAVGLGASRDLGVFLGALVIAAITVPIVISSAKSRSWGWFLGGTLVAGMAVFAVMSLFNANFMGGQLQRDVGRMGATLSSFITDFVDAAVDGARDERRDWRQ